jgi:hypothetical protein
MGAFTQQVHLKGIPSEEAFGTPTVTGGIVGTAILYQSRLRAGFLLRVCLCLVQSVSWDQSLPHSHHGSSNM